jgi:MFS family permease
MLCDNEDNEIYDDIENEEKKSKDETKRFCCRTMDMTAANGWIVTGAAMCFYFGTAVSALSIKYIINKRIAGDAYDPDSNSAFVDFTSTLLRSAAGFLAERYNAGFSDYIGRKPLLFFSSFGLIWSRLIVYFAYTPAHFYWAGIVGGIFDSFYFTSLAWLCDFFPTKPGGNRHKKIGIFAGTVGGCAFIAGVPLGLFMIEMVGLRCPLLVAMALAIFTAVILVATDADDTIGTCRDPGKAVHIWGNRYLPINWSEFFLEHFPIGLGSVRIIMSAPRPWDWLGFFMLVSTSSLSVVLLVQYSLVVLHFTPGLTAVTVLMMGLAVAIIPPFLMSKYSPVVIVLYSGLTYTMGLLLLAIAGSMATLFSARVTGTLGIVLFCCGISWAPSYHSILSSQYDESSQGNLYIYNVDTLVFNTKLIELGVVNGLISQLKELGIFPAYAMSLLFSFSLRADSTLARGAAFFVVSNLVRRRW